MIVRERPDSFVLFKQHDHGLAAGEIARRWAEEPRPLGSVLYAVANHDLGWRELDEEVLWDEGSGRPHSFMSLPQEAKLPAQGRGIDLVEEADPYAACLYSMHQVRFLSDAGGEAEALFRDAELARQGRLRAGMSEVKEENLERNFRFLRLCDGISLFVCLNEPGGADRPPPYPGGFAFEGRRFEPVWEDGDTLRLDPNPFSGPFDIAVPYEEVGRDGRSFGGDVLRLRVTC